MAPAQAAPAWIPDDLRAWQPGLQMIHAGREEEGFEWILNRPDRRNDAKKHYRMARGTAGPYDRYARAAEYFLKNRYTRG